MTTGKLEAKAQEAKESYNVYEYVELCANMYHLIILYTLRSVILLY